MNSLSPQGDSTLWLTAFGLSLLAHLLLVPLIGFCLIQRDSPLDDLAAGRGPEPRVLTLELELEPAAVNRVELPKPPEPVQTPKEFMRTSPDQSAPPERETPFIGERNTRATSDLPPDPTAPRLPSQRGIDRPDREMETTESRYQDGELVPTPAAAATPTGPPVDPVAAVTPPSVTPPQDPVPVAPQLVQSQPKQSPPPERLLQGTTQVDRLVPNEKPPELPPTPKQPPEPSRQAVAQTPPAPASATAPPATTTKTFQGNQRKTAIIGSISRTGRSALDVEDSVLGRYQAQISRAVELEWQRNCVRHRDFITPGFLTVRFFVESSGRIRSVQFVGDMETGEVQKGFTLNSIRDAPIPPMPEELRRAQADEPLELIFRFFF